MPAIVASRNSDPPVKIWQTQPCPHVEVIANDVQKLMISVKLSKIKSKGRI